jgi:hypothetical protein
MNLIGEIKSNILMESLTTGSTEILAALLKLEKREVNLVSLTKLSGKMIIIIST